MSPIPLAPKDANKRALRLLLQNVDAADTLLQAAENWLENEQRTLNELAVQSLLNPDLHAKALLQLGRVELAKDFISYMSSLRSRTNG